MQDNLCISTFSIDYNILITRYDYNQNSQFTSDINLVAIVNVMTKVKMLDICKKLDFYVSPNLKKDETARRVVREILDNPCEVLHVLIPDRVLDIAVRLLRKDIICLR